MGATEGCREGEKSDVAISQIIGVKLALRKGQTSVGKLEVQSRQGLVPDHIVAT